ncbi:MAG: S8 family peptidase [Clostridiales bacterium]|nr:S8 family peptidase [Clostridiales bacterium]
MEAQYAKPSAPTGKGIGIAVLDTGVGKVRDLCEPVNRIAAFVDFIAGKSEPYDDNAHGTHVAGIAAGNGLSGGGKYAGVAPGSSIIGVKILDSGGSGDTSDVMAGIQWVIANRQKYNIRVANLSVGTSDMGSDAPLVRAVEAAWDRGIVVCVAAGNNGPDPGSVTSPGVSRKVITVGSSDDNNSVEIWGSRLVNFSGRGPTLECVVKPDILAPGTNVASCLCQTPNLEGERKELKIISKDYARMSGTSMSTPMVSGAVALMLEKYPFLTPNDIKYLLKRSAVSLRYPRNHQGWGALDVKGLLSQRINHRIKY